MFSISGCADSHLITFRQVVPKVRRVECVFNFVERVPVKVFFWSDERDVRFLYTAGDKEGLILISSSVFAP